MFQAGLAPEGRPDDMLDHVIGPHASLGRVALVGHLPSMGYVLSSLLGKHGLSMSKGAVARLTWQPGSRSATLVWVMTPRRLDPVASLDAL